MRLKDRVAIVTGGARGIGAATCRKLAAEGAWVAAFDLDLGGAESIAAEIKAAGGQAMAVSGDVSNRASVTAAMEQVVAQWGRLEILVNNAGVIRDNLLHKMTDDDWDLVLNIHLKGAFLCSQIAQGYMVQQKYGRIVMLSSTGALGNRGQANYSSAKAGLTGLARTLALELGQFGITVNAVAPGFIATDMARQTAQRLGLTFEDFLESVRKNVAVRRVGQPQDVANVIAFLVSDEASYVNGQTIYVAGGPRG